MEILLPEKVDYPASLDSAAASREFRARSLQAVHAIRVWMQQYPELFGTQVQLDCFITIGMLTTHSDRIPSLSSLYRSLPYAENSVRSYVRSLAIGGWISFVREPGKDRRSIGLRIAPPLARIYNEYFALLEGLGRAATPNPGLANAPTRPLPELGQTSAARIAA